MPIFTSLDSRGPISGSLLSMLNTLPGEDPDIGTDLLLDTVRSVRDAPDILSDEDLQLALLILYSLHYGGLGNWDPRWEWQAKPLSIRLVIEERFESVLRGLLPVPDLPPAEAEAVAAELFKLTAEDSSPSVSKYVARQASVEQAREIVVHKSLYTLKEADPHSWAIPRLQGRAKAALVEIQADEYGGGRPDQVQATIFAGTMRGMDLSDAYGYYVNHLPALTLASFNMMSMFGLHRRLRGATTGHLAAFEMTSSISNRFYGNGFRRLGYGADVTWYFDEHVEADAVHEQIAGRDLAGALAEDEPDLLPDIIFGAQACLYMDSLTGAHLLDTWNREESSLRQPLSESVALP
ncbi:iron-containing redox enzyme family protein [Arthrobacter glacialis]|nr:iron-containing redox enzyme family protein [Arthrobacter glacialis]